MNLLCTFQATRVLTKLEATEQRVITEQDECISKCFEAQAEFSKGSDDYNQFRVEIES